MLNVQTILHPTDFSETSEYAYHLAAALARDQEARLVLLHVAAAPATSIGGTQAVPPDPKEFGRPELEARLQKVAAAELHDRLEREVVFGDPATEIVNAAKRWGADLIVMGTHGRGGIGRVLMGSVAEHVVRQAPCPVMTARRPQA